MIVQMPIDYGRNFYHFTKCETALLYILPSAKLKLNSFLKSNDPKENKTFGFWSILEDIDDFNYFELKEAFKIYLRDNCKQLCFSQDYVKNSLYTYGYRHPTMWAHYTDNSKGVCLVIDREKFVKENSQLFKAKGEIKYKKILNFPRLSYNDWGKNKDHYFERFLLKNSQKLFFQKHYHWNSEHEFKFIGLGQNEYCSIENSLVGVYLGPDFDNKLFNVVFNVTSPYKVEVETLYVNDGEFHSRRLDDPDDLL